jgi:hypothetical protein
MRAYSSGLRGIAFKILSRLQRGQALTQQCRVAAQRIAQNRQNLGPLRFRKTLRQGRAGQGGSQGGGKGGKQQASLHDGGVPDVVMRLTKPAPRPEASSDSSPPPLDSGASMLIPIRDAPAGAASQEE